ncbi:MAG TPA: hypothetical protein VHE61_05140 [Opitutaceae bacterium]|nr:hypothetical protein [Opitutaceae bacterium]
MFLLIVPGMLLGAGDQQAPRNFLAEISAARVAWTTSSARIHELLATIRQHANVVLALTGQIEKQNRVVANLRFEMKQALEDMRNGEFCTGCGKTRRQIEAEGDHFPHPGQSIRPATPEELAKCRRDYEAKIAQAQDRLNQLEQQKKDETQRASDAYFKFQQLDDVYHQQQLDEKDARLAEWSADFGRFKQQIDELRRKVVAEQTLRDHAASPDERAACQTRLDVHQQLLASTSERIRAATARSQQDEREFFAAANADMDRLGSAASEIHQIFGIPDGWYIDKLVRSSSPLAYTVYLVPGVDYSGQTDAAMSSAQDLLGGPGAPAAGKSAPDTRSASELLEGK